jgi:selenocysteine-specific elongation factor
MRPIVNEARKNIMLGTAGHVDHGKTALVKLLTGCDTDRLEVEKRRGLTIELGFAPCKMTDERIVGVVDVPGHVDFIRNMVAAAHGIDVVILVVAADDGVMPQTREHLDILTLMGARHGLVALTKTDLVDSEMRDLAIEELREYLRGTFLESAAICPVSNITGEGFEGFFAALNDAVAACRPHPSAGLFRLWSERVFKIHGFGTVVSGVPTSGEVRAGDRLHLQPDGLVGRVRGLQVYGRDAEIGRAGECVALNLADIDSERLGRGKVLVESEAFEAVSMFEAELALLSSVPGAMKDYALVHVHVGTGEAMGRVAILDGGAIVPGEGRLVQMRLTEPLCVAPGERFVVRAGMAHLAGGRTTTLGGGVVLDTSNQRLRRNRPWTLDALRARKAALDSPMDWCEAVLREAKLPVSAEELARRAKQRVADVGGYLDSLKVRAHAVHVAGRLWAHCELLDATIERIAAAIGVFHDAHPLRAAMSLGELRGVVDCHEDLLTAALESAVASGTIERSGEALSLPGKGARLSDEDSALRSGMERALRSAGLAPPLMEDLSRTLGATADRCDAMVSLLIDEGVVVRLDRKVVMHREAIDRARGVAMELFARSDSFETVEFRDALGVSRKYAVPLLDYFDSIRLTVRSGSRRRPGAAAGS